MAWLKLVLSSYVHMYTLSSGRRMTDNPQMGMGILHFWGPSHISGMVKARVIKVCTQVGCVKC